MAAQGDYAVNDVAFVERRRSNFRMLAALSGASLLLIAFIFALGDLRRKQNAMTFASHVVADLQERVGPDGHLPLNLKPHDGALGGGVRLEMEWLPEEDARLLRGSDAAVLAARTQPLPLTLTRDGRAAIWFEKGVFRLQWMSSAEFQAANQAQIARLAELRGKRS